MQFYGSFYQSNAAIKVCSEATCGLWLFFLINIITLANIVESTQKQPNCKKRCCPCKKGSMKKVVKSKVAAQKWLWWSDDGKNFNNISGKFVLPLPTGNQHQNSPEMLLLKFFPLSDHHSHFWAATFDFTTFFMLPFFCMGRTFFYSLAVFV